ncbi:hypothetical protein [Polaromonas sp.]|uniref:hypothetical protein n=1 Tax=Polaromonas sp. TaxID=1869339 RepID=UPI002FC6BCF4
MKSTAASATKRKPAGLIQAGSAFTTTQLGKPLATSVVLKTKPDARRQHAAIVKLMKMCQASPVVKNASRGITAEVRRDRDRGHE